MYVQTRQRQFLRLEEFCSYTENNQQERTRKTKQNKFIIVIQAVIFGELVIDREPPRALRQHLYQPMIKRLYAECTLSFQLIKLINAMRRDPTDYILRH